MQTGFFSTSLSLQKQASAPSDAGDSTSHSSLGRLWSLLSRAVGPSFEPPSTALYRGFYWKTLKRAVDCTADDKASCEERLSAAEYLLVYQTALKKVLNGTMLGCDREMRELEKSIDAALAKAKTLLPVGWKAVEGRVAQRSFDEMWSMFQALLAYKHAGLLSQTQKPRIHSVGYKDLMRTDKTLRGA
jgi:hypothetical protein